MLRCNNYNLQMGQKSTWIPPCLYSWVCVHEDLQRGCWNITKTEAVCSRCGITWGTFAAGSVLWKLPWSLVWETGTESGGTFETTYQGAESVLFVVYFTINEAQYVSPLWLAQWLLLQFHVTNNIGLIPCIRCGDVSMVTSLVLSMSPSTLCQAA